MPEYLFLLGNTPQLALAEISSLIPQQEVVPWHKHLAYTRLESDKHAQQLQAILGGVFKVLKIIKPLPSSETEAEQEVVNYLQDFPDKIIFGLTSFRQDQLRLQASQVKTQLKKMGKTVRYRETEQWGLSTAIMSHEEHCFDLLLIKLQDQVYLTQTIAFQDLESWVERDRNKPYTAGKKGMLPPKLARTMVNLGLGRLTSIKTQKPVLYDPFCGTGTVLIEAILRGCQVIGSDIDQEAVAGTLQNLDWFKTKTRLPAEYQVFQSAVAEAHKRAWETKVDLIVTEPFLGKPNLKPQELNNAFKGLTSLYLGAFKTWTKILANQGVIVIIFPQVSTREKKYNLLKLIDKVSEYGYTLEVQPIEYGYEKAIVKRQILVFRYLSTKKNN